MQWRTDYFFWVLARKRARRSSAEHASIRIARRLTATRNHEIERRTGRSIAVGSVYAALERLEEKGFIASRLGEATSERGGRAKRYFRVTAKGLRELRETQQALICMWIGAPELEGGKA